MNEDSPKGTAPEKQVTTSSIGSRLREARRQSGLGLRPFAQALGVTHQTVLNREEQDSADTAYIQQVAKLGNCRPEWITFGSNPPEGPGTQRAEGVVGGVTPWRWDKRRWLRSAFGIVVCVTPGRASDLVDVVHSDCSKTSWEGAKGCGRQEANAYLAAIFTAAACAANQPVRT